MYIWPVPICGLSLLYLLIVLMPHLVFVMQTLVHLFWHGADIKWLACVQGTYCNVPDTCDGVALADGTCCSFELSKSGTCCEVVDKDMECCDSGVLDAAGVCQGSAVSIDYNGQTCMVRQC